MSLPLYSIDTHALFWYELDMPQLTSAARRVFDDAERGLAQLVLHPIVLAEFCWVLRKQDLGNSFQMYLHFVQTNPLYRLEPILWDDLWHLLDFAEIPEMHDRLIAIQAKRLGATLVTRDAAIQASSQVSWVW